MAKLADAYVSEAYGETHGGSIPLVSTYFFGIQRKPATPPSCIMEKPEYVRDLFSAIAGRYELVNHLLSCGLDFYWRAVVVDLIRKWRPSLVLDVATGSGDLALAMKKNFPDARVIGADFCRPMLEVARRKGLSDLVEADGMNLPFPEGIFDVATAAFGLRNMASWDKGLSEMGRVIKSGGHLLILDFSLPTLPIVRPLYRSYLHHVLPIIAGIATGRKDAYEYLGGSIEQFPSGRAMTSLIESCGFDNAQAIPLSLGTVSIYTAQRS